MALRMLVLGAAVLLFFQSPTLAFITTRPSGQSTTSYSRAPDTPFPSTIRETSVCNNNLYLSAVPGQVGFLTSPNYPFDYYNNADCRMVIDAGSGYVVKVTVIDVNLEPCCDYVELYDGYRDGSTPPIAKISSMPSDSVFYSSDQYMDIIFHSDDSDSFPGFWLTYEAVDTESEASEPTTPTSDATPEISLPDTSVCGADVSLLFAVPGQDGYLSSPNYPRPYYNYANCRWLIEAGSGYVVKVSVIDARLEDCCNFLEIFDGNLESNATRIIRTSSMPSQTVLYSSGQYMYIRFYSDISATSSVFMLTYEAVDQESVSTSDSMPTSTTPAPSVCSDDVSLLFAVPGQDGYLSSPDYPKPYYNYANCRWLIDAGSGYVVKVSVTHISLEECCDFLEIYDGYMESNATLIMKTSSIPSQPVLYSSGQYMYIRFSSDISVTDSGFRLTYEAVDKESVPPSVCPVNGMVLSALPGQVDYLRFPNHPSNHSSSAHCEWLINSTSGYVIKLTVLHASSEIFYYIEIFDGMSESSPTLVTFNAMPLQTVYYSSGQYMYIRYTGLGSVTNSGIRVTNSGLRITYEAVNQPFEPNPSPTIPTTTPQTSDPCTCTCSCVSACSSP